MHLVLREDPLLQRVVEVTARGRRFDVIHQMRARRMSAGATSCFSGLSAPTAATKHPRRCISSVRTGEFDVVQVTQISASATAAPTLGIAFTGHVAVDQAVAKACARATSMSKALIISRGNTVRRASS